MVDEKVLFRLVQIIHQVRPQFQERGSWFLLHEIARPHTRAAIKQFFAEQVIPELNPAAPSPPCSPDLSPPDVFLFPEIKSTLKVRRFEDPEDIKRRNCWHYMEISSKSVSNNFMREQKSV
jgi:hypothetical protein